MKMNNNMIRTLMVGVALLLAMMVNAQSRSLPLLEAPTDARAVAMGGQTLIHTESNYIFLNPVSILYGDQVTSVGVTGMMYPSFNGVDGTLMYGNFSAAYRLHDRHVLHVGGRYQGGLTYPGGATDQFGKPGKDISPYDYSVDLAYGFRITDQLAAFATGSFLQSYIAEAAYSAGFGLGVNYHSADLLPMDGALFNAAVAVRDLGAPIEYNGTNYDLPSNVTAGVDVRLPFAPEHVISFAVGARYFFMPTNSSLLQLNVGGEYSWNDMIAIRGGFQYGQNETSVATFGAGVHFAGFRLDATYLLGIAEYTPNRPMFTIGYSF